MAANGEGIRRADVVILTAIALEYQAAKQVRAGAWEGSQWEEEKGLHGLPVAFRTFQGRDGLPLRVVLALAGDKGAVAATNALLTLVDTYQPQCVAMCGVCAGRPGKTNLGDVIAAERLFFHDTGKKLSGTVQQDLKTYILREGWKAAIEGFDFVGRFREEAWWKKRPIPYEWQENWVLAQLHAGVPDPSAIPECRECCPQWEQVIEALWRSGHVKDGELRLTEEGRKRIGRVLIRYRNRLPDLAPAGRLSPFQVHVAPMGSGSQGIEDEKTWESISESMRKVLGLDLEAAALGALVHVQRDLKLDAVVMKGVMDFGTPGRDDHFKEFAARASAECLLAFLCKQLNQEVVPDIEGLLVSGTQEQLPENPPPSALLNAAYEVVPFHLQGREVLLEELDRWCEEGPSVAARLLYAAGGVGKTRLAIEWIRRRRAQKWAAGFLPREVPDGWFDRLWALRHPVLVVIDYAESRPDLSAVLARMHRYAEQEGAGRLHRVRLLLLARNAGDWWHSLLQSETVLGAWLRTTPPHKLEPLATTEAEREEVFHEAAEGFARRRGKEYALRETASFADAHFERVLYLHMAALASVEGVAFEASTLMDAILDHEERFWEARARQDELTLSLQRSLARQVVAAATLRGGLADFESTLGFIERSLGQAPSENERKLALLLHNIYQQAGQGQSSFLPPLEPDLLGVGMVLRVASPKLEKDRVPSNWMERVFPPHVDDEAAVERGLTVLRRVSAIAPEVARPWLEQLL